MFALLIGPAVVYVLVATWAVRSGGVRRLCAVAIAAIAVLFAAGAGVGVLYAVPSLPRLLVYVALLFTPMVVVTAAALTPDRVRVASFRSAAAIAAAGALAGLTLGVFAAVYGSGLVRS